MKHFEVKIHATYYCENTGTYYYVSGRGVNDDVYKCLYYELNEDGDAVRGGECWMTEYELSKMMRQS